MRYSASPRKVFGVALAAQVTFCALVILTTVWTFEIYRYAMLPYWPVAFAWERFLPWGKDRDQVSMALSLWIPLIGCVSYSAVAYVVALIAKRK
jgi:hypothetical protein